MNNGKRRNQNSIKIVIIRKSIITLAIIRFFHFEYLINLRNRLIITIINKKEVICLFSQRSDSHIFSDPYPARVIAIKGIKKTCKISNNTFLEIFKNVVLFIGFNLIIIDFNFLNYVWQ